MRGRRHVRALRLLGVRLLALLALADAGVVRFEDADALFRYSSEHPDELVVIKFFAKWCGACRTLAPEYERAAAEVDESYVRATLTELDVDAPDAQRYVKSIFRIEKLPTVLGMRAGGRVRLKPMPFGEEHAQKDIVVYVRESEVPAWTVVDAFADGAGAFLRNGSKARTPSSLA